MSDTTNEDVLELVRLATAAGLSVGMLDMERGNTPGGEPTAKLTLARPTVGPTVSPARFLFLHGRIGLVRWALESMAGNTMPTAQEPTPRATSNVRTRQPCTGCGGTGISSIANRHVPCSACGGSGDEFVAVP